MSQTKSGVTAETALWRSGPSMAYAGGRLLRISSGHVEVYEEKQWRDSGATELPPDCTPAGLPT